MWLNNFQFEPYNILYIRLSILCQVIACRNIRFSVHHMAGEDVKVGCSHVSIAVKVAFDRQMALAEEEAKKEEASKAN